MKAGRAKKILRMAEKQLLQARVKFINSLLDNNSKQIETTRSKIASILPISSYRKCQDFIEKVKELRFSKVKERQVRKFNNLLSKKEGNITCISFPQATRASLAARAFLANRQLTPATRATQAIQATNSQAVSQVNPSTPRQASQGENTLTQIIISQGSTLPGSAPLQAEGTASWEASTTSLADSKASQAPHARLAVRHSARLRALHAPQAGNSPQADSAISQGDIEASHWDPRQAIPPSRQNYLPRR